MGFQKMAPTHILHEHKKAKPTIQLISHQVESGASIHSDVFPLLPTCDQASSVQMGQTNTG